LETKLSKSILKVYPASTEGGELVVSDLDDNVEVGGKTKIVQERELELEMNPRCMTEIKISEYYARYQEQVADLIISIQSSEFGVAITLDDQPDLREISTFYQTKNGNFWIATIEGVLIGTIALLDIGNGRGALRKMFVDKNYRGKEIGVGQKLLNTLLGWAVEKEFYEILLGTTEEFVAAQRFYEKNGFVEVLKEALPAEFPRMAVDNKFYMYTLEVGK
jgi:GNAT superfamily N-acetyltransferase